MAQNVTKQTISHVNQLTSSSPTTEPLYQEVNRANSEWDAWGVPKYDTAENNGTASADINKEPQISQEPKKSNDDWEDW